MKDQPEVVAERGFVASLISQMHNAEAFDRGSESNIALSAWETLTPAIRAMIARHVGEPPANLRTPEAMAWLDRAAARPSDPDYLVRRGLRDLSAEEACRLAERVIDQEIAWRAEGLIPQHGCVAKIDGIVFYFLAAIRGSHGPLDLSLEPKVRPLELAIFDLFGTYVPGGEDDPMEGMECPCFLAGVALIPASDAGERAPAARAAHGEWLRDSEFAVPLMVVLDIDLTRPEMAFLGLEGTRLRVCDWVDHDYLNPCFTRVGLDGEVALLEQPTSTEVMGEPDRTHDPLVPGPAFYSSIDGEDDGPGFASYHARIGGGPGWEQEPDVPISPDSGEPMTFIAQFPHPNGCMAYVFLDPINLIATVVTQCD